MRLFNFPNSAITDRERTFICNSLFQTTIFDLKMSGPDDPIDEEDIEPSGPGEPSFNLNLGIIGMTYMNVLQTTANTLRKPQ